MSESMCDCSFGEFGVEWCFDEYLAQCVISLGEYSCLLRSSLVAQALEQ